MKKILLIRIFYLFFIIKYISKYSTFYVKKNFNITLYFFFILTNFSFLM